MTAANLQDMIFPPLTWIVDGYVAAGLTVLAGKPKLGKSWLALEIALSVSTGSYALGARACARGAVLYAALEDNQRRLQDRIDKVWGPGNARPWPDQLTLWTCGEMARLEAGGLDQLRIWARDNPDAALIIIDTLAKVRSGALGRETAYETDYREVGSLKALADELGVAIIVITHTRKMEADDPFDAVSGTLGITGAADTTLILSRDGLGIVLRATGRDVPELETAVEFRRDLFRWCELGEASEIRLSDERSDLIRYLLEAGEAMTPAELASVSGKKPGNVRRLLGKMVRTGEVHRVGRAKYVHPDCDPGNIGNAGTDESSLR